MPAPRVSRRGVYGSGLSSPAWRGGGGDVSFHPPLQPLSLRRLEQRGKPDPGQPWRPGAWAAQDPVCPLPGAPGPGISKETTILF